MTITATYINNSSFSLSGDQTNECHYGRRILCDCGVDGNKGITVSGSSYGANTTVYILTNDSDTITSNLESIRFGPGISKDQYGSISIYGITNTLSGTLQTAINNVDISGAQAYTDSKISTLSGTLASAISSGDSSTLSTAEAYTDSEVTTLSGVLQTAIDNVDISGAQAYTDSEISTLSGTLNSAISSGDSSTLSTAEAYTDSEISTLSGTLASAISSGDSSTLSTAEAYTDVVSGTLQSQIDNKSDTGHTHDDRYYTESEVNGLLSTNSSTDQAYTDSEIATLSGSIVIDHGALTGLVDDDHTQYLLRTDFTTASGNIVNQIPSDYYTQSEVNTISGVINTKFETHKTSSDHDGRYYTESEIDTTLLDYVTTTTLTTASGNIINQFPTDFYSTGEVDTISGALQNNIDGKQDIGSYEPANENIQSHISSTSNPHSVDETDILPDQTSHSGEFLTTNGSVSSWAAGGGGGDVVDDTTPQLGGDLDLNGNAIVDSVNWAGATVLDTGHAGLNNILIGQGGAQAFQTGGNHNIVMGLDAGKSITTGDSNFCLGKDSGSTITTQGQNVFVGNSTGVSSVSTGNVCIGHRAGKSIASNSITAIGYYAGEDATGANNVLIGYEAGKELSTATNNVLIGHGAASALTTGGVNLGGNVCIGYNSGKGMTSSTSSARNVYIGTLAGNNGGNSVAIGYEAGTAETMSGGDGGENVLIGYQTGKAVTIGEENVFIGNSTGIRATTGFRNTLIGRAACSHITTPSDNTALGNHAGWQTTTGNLNTFLGSYTSNQITTGHRNTTLGAYAHEDATTASGCVVIGFRAGQSENNHNRFIVETEACVTPLLYGTFGNGTLGVNTTNNTATLNVGGDLLLNSGTSVNEFSTDGTMAGNSDDAVPTEKAVKTYVDNTSGITDHGELDGLSDDDHTQYHNDTRGDTRYYTKTLLNNGQLDDRYYTETEIDTISGSLSSEIDSDIATHASSSDHDSRYYTTTQVDTISGTLSSAISSGDSSTLSTAEAYTDSEISTLSGTLASDISSGDSSTLSTAETYTDNEISTLSGTLTGDLTVDSIKTGDGAEATPAYSFTSDPNTGIYSPASDQLGISTAGTERMRIGASGNVGIGTTSLGAKLDVMGAYDATENTQAFTVRENGFNRRLDVRFDGGGTVISSSILSSSNASGFTFKAGLTPDTYEYVRIDASGNVGIGTTSPGAKLDVNGDITLASGATINEFSTDTTLSGNSDDAVPTEKAVKTYVDNMSGVTDHGELDGLSDDDHTQYLLRTDFTTASGNIVDQFPTDFYSTGEVDTISGSLQTQIDDITPGISELKSDTTPELGGDLNTGSYTVSGTGNIITGDHGTATTAQVVNVCYGTGSPPSANSTTIGTIYIKYTA